MKKIGVTKVAFVIAGTITIVCLYTATALYLKAVDYKDTARGVDIYVMIETNTITNGVPFAADILITNDTTPLNVMEAEVLFDPTLFAVTDFSFGTTLCENQFVIEKTIDNSAGVVHASCGTITPFTGNVTVFGTMTIIPLQAGISTLTFGEKTHVYIHDGLGTEIARDKYTTTIVTNEATAS